MAANSTSFKKGDPRINRKGRPKTFDAARELAQAIAQEKANNTEGQPIVIDGHLVTVIEAIFRKWASSHNAQLQRAFVEYAYGSPPTRNELTGAEGGAVTIRIVDEIQND